MSHKLTAKQIKALYLLAAGQPIILIARELKMRRETLSRWRKIPEFIQEYERIVEEMRFDLRNQITALMETSIRSAKRAINCSDSDPKRIQTLLNVIKSLEKETVT